MNLRTYEYVLEITVMVDTKQFSLFFYVEKSITEIKRAFRLAAGKLSTLAKQVNIHNLAYSIIFQSIDCEAPHTRSVPT